MKIFFALLIVTFLAFSGYHLTFRSFKLPLFARKFYLTGTEFLFLGLLLGPQFFNLLDTQTLKNLEPLGALLLGWIGLLFGFQFELAKLKRFLPEFFLAAVFEGLLTFVLVFCGVYFFLPLFINLSVAMQIVVSFVLASAATCTAQTGIALFAPDSLASRQNTIILLRYTSSIDSLLALVLFSPIFFFRSSLYTGPSWIRELGWTVGLIFFACLGLLIIYILFLSQRRNENELTLMVIGMAVLTSGAASIINHSPLLINFFLGFCLVNLTRDKERIFNILISVEKPAYLLLLFFLGGTWKLDAPWIFYAAAGYCLLRAMGKLSGGYFITRLSSRLKRQPATLGYGMLEQGGLPFAILFDFQKGFPFEASLGIISLALLAILYNDFLSSNLLKLLLKEEEK